MAETIRLTYDVEVTEDSSVNIKDIHMHVDEKLANELYRQVEAGDLSCWVHLLDYYKMYKTYWKYLKIKGLGSYFYLLESGGSGDLIDVDITRTFLTIYTTLGMTWPTEFSDDHNTVCFYDVNNP